MEDGQTDVLNASWTERYILFYGEVPLWIIYVSPVFILVSVAAWMYIPPPITETNLDD